MNFISALSFRIQHLTILAICLLFSIPMEAQSLPQRIQRRLERKIERKLERKVDETIDRKWDEAEEKNRKKRAAKDSTQTSESGVKVTVSDDDGIDSDVEASEFTGEFTMETITYKKGKMDKDSPYRMTFHIAPYQSAIQLPEEKKGEQSIMILDRRTRKITQKIDSKDGKTAMITRMPKFMIEIEDTDTDSDVADAPDVSIRATGRTKSIAGYTAEEYEVESEEYLGLVWVTDEVDIRGAMSLGMFDFQGNKRTSFGVPTYASGSVLEAHYEHKTKDETSDYYIKNLREGSPDESIFSLDGYEVTDVSRFQFGR